jgi:uncharacterized membrane protein (UPF0127 family)
LKTRPDVSWAALPVLLLFFSAACVSQSAPPAAGNHLDASAKSDATIPVVVQSERGPVTFQAEVVDTPAARQRGLMFREYLPEATGMLFVFPSESPRSFWMRNTLIPLDMIFVKADKTILGIVENTEPKTDRPRSVPGSSQFVLELSGGSASRYRLQSGQNLLFQVTIPKQ